MSRPAIRLTNLTKTFGAVTAVDHVDLEIAAGEFFSMLGPSDRARPRCCD
jgi:putative spermidine/putrescine transport system ATP-binding protein